MNPKRSIRKGILGRHLNFLLFLGLLWVGNANAQAIGVLQQNGKGGDSLSYAFSIAIGDLVSNIRPIKRGLLKEKSPTFFAGADYIAPWTRDAATNVFFAGGLLYPEVAKNTLTAQLSMTNGTPTIDGQYWDSPIWIIGAWEYYLVTGDFAFLKTAYRHAKGHLSLLHENEFDADRFLYRGPSYFNDGVSAYPEPFNETGNYTGGEWVSTITKWAAYHSDKKHPVGFGMPMLTLSTNAIYKGAYDVLAKMAAILAEPVMKRESEMKSTKLKSAINKYFWDEPRGTYNYMIYDRFTSTAQEAAGLAFCILFDIVDSDKTKKIFENVQLTKFGIPCLFPNFPRYQNYGDQTDYGRHSGTIWPHINALWGLAAAKVEQRSFLMREISTLTRFAIRDRQFYELFHPKTGLPYGGIQESNNGDWTNWEPAKKQTWAATGYLALVMKGLFGMKFTENGILFRPNSQGYPKKLELVNVPYRKMMLSVVLVGEGVAIDTFTINGEIQETAFVPYDLQGNVSVIIHLK